MLHWFFWLCAVFLIGSGMAVDVPFVFDGNSSGVADYSAAQLESMRVSSSDLAGVPLIATPSDNEILQFPVTGGGNAPESTTEKRVIELKMTFDERVDLNNSDVLNQGAILASKYPGDLTVDQVSSIYNFLKNGDGNKRGWSYVRDRRGLDYYRYANESLSLGEKADCSGVGDCDDFAILMSALIESIGGTTRIILARNSSIGGHAYTEVYLGNLSDQNNQVEDIINWLKDEFYSDKIYTHIDTETKDVWLNLDWGLDEKGNAHPGGPFYQGDTHIVLCIRDTFGKTPLKPPEETNKLPELVSLIPDKPNPQNAETIITWTAKAKDPENDQILYRFLMNDNPVTEWAKENLWVWTTSENDLGESQIEVQVRDGKHAGQNKYDANNVTSFIINAPPSESQESANQRLICDADGDQSFPVVGGNDQVGYYVAWMDNRTGNPDIYVYSLAQKIERTIADGPYEDMYPDIKGSTIGWISRNPLNDYKIDDYWSIRTSDLSTFNYNEVVFGLEYAAPISLSSNSVAYLRKNYFGWAVYVRPFYEKEVIPDYPPNGINPRAGGDYVVYQDNKSGSYDIWMWKQGSDPVALANYLGEQMNAATDGYTVVWQDNRNGNWDIYAYNLNTREETQITKDLADQTNPDVENGVVVWQDNRNGNWDIYIYNCNAQKEKAICTDAANQTQPRINAERIVWTDDRSGDKDIYLYENY
jgi:beta propeller repeat protein